jgi:uncharacterized protein YkwD
MRARLQQTSIVKLRLLTFVCLLVALGCPHQQASLWNTAKPNVKATPEAARLEREMFGRLNQDRTKAGLPPLAYDERLADVARAHTKDMQQNDFFAHESPTTGLLEDRMDRAGYLAAEMRENLASAADVQRAQANLMKSPGHRRNILAESVTHVGIGIIRGDAAGDDRMLLITQVFARPAKLATPEETVPAVLGVLNAARRKAGLPPLATHPLLVELAEGHIADLPDDVDTGAVSDIGSDVASVLNERDDHQLASVQILAQAVFDASEFTASRSVLRPRATHVGIAAAKARDDRGRPRVKVLALVGQR